MIDSKFLVLIEIDLVVVITGEWSGGGIEVDWDIAGYGWARCKSQHCEERWESYQKSLASQTWDRHG